MQGASSEQFRFEPTVFGAVRRHPFMVVAVALLTAAAAVGYTVVTPEIYRASASVTVPQEQSMEGQAPEQYLDSQVLLLQSLDVAQRAVGIANHDLGSEVLTTADFIGDGKSLQITPPEGANPGSYGANTVDVSFTSPSKVVAQVGANAVLRAFDEARTEAIRAHGEAVIAGIERAFLDPRARDQVADLVNQRSDVLVTTQVDLARRPTVAWAVEPQIPINGNSRVAGGVGLLLGAVLGAALAFGRATRRKHFDDRGGPAALYQAPLIGEVSASTSGKWPFRGGTETSYLPVVSTPTSAGAENFRLAAAAVERMRTGHDRAQSLVFVSPGVSAGRSAVVANLALAIAEGGTRVLAVDADRAGELTSLLLPDNPYPDGFAQALAGERAVHEYLQTSPWNGAVAVLGSGRETARRMTGATFARAFDKLLSDVTTSFDVVLIDSPPLLESADATTLGNAADGLVIVVGTRDLVRDHVQVTERLELIETDVVGYIVNRQTVRPADRRDAEPSSLVESAPQLGGTLQQARP